MQGRVMSNQQGRVESSSSEQAFNLMNNTEGKSMDLN